MAGVDIQYKGSSIASIQGTGYKTLKTSGKYCEGDITIDYIKEGITPSGTMNITADGIYDVTDKASVNVAASGFSVNNIIQTAVDTDGTPYEGGAGFKEGYRLNTSGNEVAYTEYSVSGYIPVSVNDLIRVINAGEVAGYSLLAFGYNSNFAVVGSSYINLNPVTAGNGALMYGFKVLSGVSYIRVSFNKAMNAKIIVTKNEIISPLEV